MNNQDYLDALLTLPAVYGAKVSGDGKWVAWAWIRTAPTSEVYVAPSDGSAEPLRLTNTPDNTYLVGWAHDSKSVLVSEDKNGNERERIFRVWLDKPLEMQPLIEENPNYFIRGGELSKDGKVLIYAANIDLATGQEIEPTVVIRHNLETGERITLACPEKGGYNLPFLNPNNDKILYWRGDLNPSGNQLWVVNIDGSDDHEILNVGDDKKAFGEWLPDGSLAVQAETGSYWRVGAWSESGVKWLIDDPTRQIESIFVPTDSNKIVVEEVRDAKLSVTLLDPETGEEIAFPKLAGTLKPIAPLPNGEWLGVYLSSTHPSDIVRFSMDAKSADELQSISNVWKRTSLKREDLSAAEDFRWTSSDGLQIQGWLYRPKEKAVGTVVYVHGGPTYHSSDAINNQIQYYVRQGFNVLDPNYRGSTGFGLTFRDKIKEDGWGGMEQVDIRRGIEALIEQGIAEAGKVGITGTSYGGYSSWHAISHFPTDVVAASAPICGMTDLVVDYETTRPDLRPYSEEMMGGKPEQVPQKYYERSAINFVQNVKGRLLIVQGMQDPNVHPKNVTEVRQKLDAANVEYGVLAFDDEGHGISKPKNQKVLYTELAQFFASAFSGE
jgi:dienelactone hydrolase